MTYLTEVMGWLDTKNGPYVHKAAWEAPDELTMLRLVREYYDNLHLTDWKLVEWRVQQ